MGTIYGTPGGDERYGTLSNDVFHMLDGNDRAYAFDGHDTMYGGGGNDELNAGYGHDYLDGGTGNDTLWGADGNDTLVGGMDNDVMYGGVGADKFVTTSITDMWGIGDRIADFHWWEGDKIDLSGVDAKAYDYWSPSTWGNNGFLWKGYTGNTNISLGKGELAYFQNGENTLLYGNVDGDSSFEICITLTGSVRLEASDIYL